VFWTVAVGGGGHAPAKLGTRPSVWIWRRHSTTGELGAGDNLSARRTAPFSVAPCCPTADPESKHPVAGTAPSEATESALAVFRRTVAHGPRPHFRRTVAIGLQDPTRRVLHIWFGKPLMSTVFLSMQELLARLTAHYHSVRLSSKKGDPETVF